MKTVNTLLVTLFLASSALAADSATNQVSGALAKLKNAANYSWTTTQVIPDMPFTSGPTKGKAEKGGYSLISQEMGDNKIEAALKGDKIALKNDTQWQLIDDADGMAAMLGGWMTMYGTADNQASTLIGGVSDLTAGENGLVTGTLTPEGAKALTTFRARGNAAQAAPVAKNAHGTVKFWVKDGALVKFESHTVSTMAMGDQGEQAFDVTRTTEISDVGTTKLDVPAEAKAKLDAKPAIAKP